jgi:GNAT superfamily N-acetyltransferase
MTLDALRLIRMQIELEYGLDAAGRLVPFPGSSEQARYIVYRHVHGYERFFRYDLPEELLWRLAQSDPAKAFEDTRAIARLLESDLPAERLPIFASGVISVQPAPGVPSQVVFREGCCVIEVAGKPVAWAWSARSNAVSAELAVEVDPEYQRRGYGRQVAFAWARQLSAAGKVAFYSYRTSNLPSQALANSLGIEIFAHCVAFD